MSVSTLANVHPLSALPLSALQDGLRPRAASPPALGAPLRREVAVPPGVDGASPPARRLVVVGPARGSAGRLRSRSDGPHPRSADATAVRRLPALARKA